MELIITAIVEVAKDSIPNIGTYFKNIYPIIKDVQDVPEPCYVEGMIYDNGEEALDDIIYDVDEFYQELGISFADKKGRSR